MEHELRILADRWYRETGRFSVSAQKLLHPSYQRIMSHGTKALPFIIGELKKGRNHWFWALRMIAGEDQDPTNPNDSVETAIKAWIEWYNHRRETADG